MADTHRRGVDRRSRMRLNWLLPIRPKALQPKMIAYCRGVRPNCSMNTNGEAAM